MTGGGIMNGIINSSLEATLKDLLYGMGWSVTRQLISLGMVGAPERGAYFVISCCAWDGTAGSRHIVMCGAGVSLDEYTWVAML